jgi:hypothetical protein
VGGTEGAWDAERAGGQGWFEGKDGGKAESAVDREVEKDGFEYEAGGRGIRIDRNPALSFNNAFPSFYL